MTQSLDLDAVERATRPIVGIENRTAQEVFDIMCDRLLSLLREAEKRGEAWDWLAQHTSLELSWGELDDLDDTAWRVHRCSGGVNDREWDLISTGQTPLEAIQNARQALSQLTQKEAGNG